MSSTDSTTDTHGVIYGKGNTPLTSYMVLQQNAEGDWIEMGEHHASSAEAAIREAAANVRDSRVHVAVPVRSWKPVRVTVETVSRVKLEDA